MPGARYRVDSLTIEGFKAFGVPQDVLLSGKHCFLFGANARGKSSIVEAIRWCLFGLERDSDVRNRFREAADCRVELRLREAAGLWRLERRLRPGLRESELAIRNPDGDEVTRNEALPNLVRLGAGVGAVVFFSAQQAARARAYADLTRFHEVLYAHLDLVEADRLRSALSDLLEEQLEIEQRRADEVQAAEDKLREKLKQGDARLEEVLCNPPWDLDEPPTRLLSEQRVRSFVADVARELGTRARPAWECLTALDHAEKWVRERSDSRREALTRSSASAREKHLSLSAQIMAIRELREREAEARRRAKELDARLAEVCEGGSFEDLEARCSHASARLDQEARTVFARQGVAPLIGPETRECPICGLACDGTDLLVKLNADIKKAESAQRHAAAEFERLERLKAEAKMLAERRDAAKQDAKLVQRDRKQRMAQVADRLRCSPDTFEGAAERHLAQLQQRIDRLDQQGNDAAAYHSRRLSYINALRREWRYHQLREEEQRLRRDLQEGLQPARDRLRALEGLRSTANELREALQEEFDTTVDRALPGVSTQLTEAFNRLTGHPAFDVLRVHRAEGPDKLVVRVGSSSVSVPWSRPEDVLNQGAYTALGLVPHLVFSGFHAEQAELNVLIVDDPSQSFDTTHVELLLEELRRASEHAQLVLATHEEDRFRPIMERLFQRDSFVIIRVTDFRPDRGPTIEYG